MDKVRIRGAFLPVSPEEREEGVIRFRVHDNDYLNNLRAYGHEHKDTLDDQWIVVCPYDWVPSEEARNFFFEVLDIYALQDSGPMGKRDPQTKNDIRKQLLEFCGIYGLDGEVKSMKKDAQDPVTAKEWWELNQTLVQWLLESGGSLGTLRKDWDELCSN